MKKLLFFVIVLTAGAGMLFAGAQGEGSAEGDFELNEPGKYPVILSEEMYEFDALGIYSATESSGKHQDAELTAYLEELTNVRINWVEIVESAVFAERQNLILASGDLPDVIMSAWGMSAQQAYTYGLNGSLVRLNDLIDEKMPDLKKELNAYPAYLAQLTSPDGGIYALPDLEAGCFHCSMSAKFFLYKPWAEKLGLDWPPETTEDLYDMLVAFRDGDPNENGKKDEIPLMGSAAGGWNTNPLYFLMNSFIYTQEGTGGGFLQRDDGKITFVADTNAWREGLMYQAKLVDEGLLSPETYVQHNDNLRALVEHPDAPMVGSIPAGWFGVFSINGGGTGRFADYWPIAPLKGPNGVQFSRYSSPAVRFHTKITSAADRPDIITQWANWFYKDKMVAGQYSWDFKLEGIDWRYLTEDEKKLGLVSRDGTPAETLPIISDTYGLGADKKDKGWTRAAPRWTPYNVGGLPLEWKEDRSKQEYWLMIWTRDLMLPHKPEQKYIPPNLVFNEDVMDEMTDLNEGIASGTGVVMQWATEFIVGNKDIHSDGEWQNYLTELKRAGVDRYVELWQETITNAGY
jgi:putative aldouronate transport system substrate-binding protein